MIKSQRQYEVTKSQAAKFAEALRRAESQPIADPLLRKLEKDALKSQLEELEYRLSEYHDSR